MEKTQELLEELNFEDKLCIAAVNDEKNATISGDRKAMEQMDDYMKNEKPKVFWRMLKVQKAFHSHHMEPIHDKFIKEINKANIRPKTGQIPFISSVDGEKLMGHDLDPDYWWRNLRNSVLFGPCVKKMLDHGCRVLLEVSPRPVLSHYIKNIVKQTGYDEAEEEVFIFQALPSIKEKDRQQHLYVQTVGKLYSLGYPITWNEFQEQKCGKFVRYPLYSWQETSLWSRDEFVTQKTTALLLGAPTCVTAEETEWETELDIYRFDWMDDHKMKAAGVILPGATYVEMAFEAILQGEEIEPVMVKDLNFYNILPLPKQVVRLVRSQMKEKENEDMKEFSIRHVTEQGEIQLAKAFVKIIKSAAKREGIPFNKAGKLVKCTFLVPLFRGTFWRVWICFLKFLLR